MTVDVRGIAHTGLTVRDLPRALALWRDVLGFAVEREAHLAGAYPETVTGVPGAVLDLAVVQRNGQRIELLAYTGPPDRGGVRPRPCDVGASHVALTVANIEDAVSQLAAHGWALAGSVYLVDEGPRLGTRLAYLHDDDLATLELVQPPA